MNNIQNNMYNNAISMQRAMEQLRQERETYNQYKKKDILWFILQLILGYSSILILAGLAVFAIWMLCNNNKFPDNIIWLVTSFLFVDIFGLMGTVWKVIINPRFYNKLSPTTKEDASNTNQP